MSLPEHPFTLLICESDDDQVYKNSLSGIRWKVEVGKLEQVCVSGGTNPVASGGWMENGRRQAGSQICKILKLFCICRGSREMLQKIGLIVK